MSKEYAFFIVGLPESGKEVAANLLAHSLGVKHAASSSIVYDELARERGCARWELEAARKADLTPELERVGNALCAVNPSALVAPLLQRGARVIHGIRRRSELIAARGEARAQGMEPVVVWLDRHSIASDNTEVSRADADYAIFNHGTVGHLAKLVQNLANEFRPELPSMESFRDMHRLDSNWTPESDAPGGWTPEKDREDDNEDEGFFGIGESS